MGKIYPVSTKYIIRAVISATGTIDKNDIVGAIFGQTEGLLGAELELRELQKSGRIGRIDVNVETKNGETKGEIIVPSSMDKTETAIIAAALETIERIGPCTSKIDVSSVEDVRLNKREHVMERAKNLLKKMVNVDAPDTQEITDEVKNSVRTSSVIEYGPEKLAASSDIESAKEIIIVEGRADVVNMLKYGFTGIISLNGANNVPKTVKAMLKEKSCTLFVDGDRGGEIIINDVLSSGGVDYIARAPDGKEVEELAGKEIHKALRLRVDGRSYSAPQRGGRGRSSRPSYERGRSVRRPVGSGERSPYRGLLSDLFGTRGAYLLDKDMNILGKVPVSELASALLDASGVDAVVLDGTIDKAIVASAEKKGIKKLVSSNINASSDSVELIQL